MHRTIVKLAERAQERLLRERYGSPDYARIRNQLIKAKQLNPKEELEKFWRGTTKNAPIHQIADYKKSIFSSQKMVPKEFVSRSPAYGDSPYSVLRGVKRGNTTPPRLAYGIHANTSTPIGKFFAGHEGREQIAERSMLRQKYRNMFTGKELPATTDAAAIRAYKSKMYAGHMSPNVIAHERRMLPLMPRKVINTTEKLRHWTPGSVGMGEYDQHERVFGKGANVKPSKRYVKKMTQANNAFIGELGKKYPTQTPQIKPTLKIKPPSAEMIARMHNRIPKHISKLPSATPPAPPAKKGLSYALDLAKRAVKKKLFKF